MGKQINMTINGPLSKKKAKEVDREFKLAFPKRIKLAGQPPTRKKLIDDLDEVVRQIMRIKQDWTCQKCGIQHKPGTNKIQVSHFFGRKHIGTRFDYDNLDLLCGIMYYQKGRGWVMGSCHGEWEGEKNGEYRRFMIKKLGEGKLERLESKTGIAKFSRAELQIMLASFQRELRLLEYSEEMAGAGWKQ